MTDAACWQHLIKVSHANQEADRFLHDLVDRTRPIIRIIDFSEAQSFIEKYEWLGNIGSASLCYGLFYSDYLASVACFSPATSPTGFSKLLRGMQRRCIMQLCRGASSHWAPRNAASMLIGTALRDLRRARGIRVVFAYADPRAGEIGTVYQAANALYLGFTDARGPGHYVIHGRVMHPRAVYREFGSARHEVLVRMDPDYQRHQRNRKHRYVFILDSGKTKLRLTEQLSTLVKPHPKRGARANVQIGNSLKAA